MEKVPQVLLLHGAYVKSKATLPCATNHKQEACKETEIQRLQPPSSRPAEIFPYGKY